MEFLVRLYSTCINQLNLILSFPYNIIIRLRSDEHQETYWEWKLAALVLDILSQDISGNTCLVQPQACSLKAHWREQIMWPYQLFQFILPICTEPIPCCNNWQDSQGNLVDVFRPSKLCVAHITLPVACEGSQTPLVQLLDLPMDLVRQTMIWSTPLGPRSSLPSIK